MDLEYTSDFGFTNLIMDGNYLGCYLITELVEAGKNRVDIDTENNEFMIEYEMERAEEDVYYFEVGNLRFAFAEPEEPYQEQYYFVIDTMEDIYDALETRDIDIISKCIDVDSFAKYYIINEYAKTVDFDYSSVKFYYKNKKLYAGPCWDFDLSSGNCNKNNYPRYYEEVDSYNGIYCKTNLFDLLLECDGFVEKISRYIDEYKDELINVYEENGLIDFIYANNKDVIDRNYTSIENDGAGWQTDKNYSGLEGKRYSTYKETIDNLKEWLYNRYNYLYSYYCE